MSPSRRLVLVPLHHRHAGSQTTNSSPRFPSVSRGGGTPTALLRYGVRVARNTAGYTTPYALLLPHAPHEQGKFIRFMYPVLAFLFPAASLFYSFACKAFYGMMLFQKHNCFSRSLALLSFFLLHHCFLDISHFGPVVLQASRACLEQGKRHSNKGTTQTIGIWRKWDGGQKTLVIHGPGWRQHSVLLFLFPKQSRFARTFFFCQVGIHHLHHSILTSMTRIAGT